MARPVDNPAIDRGDWIIRAKEELTAAQAMPQGPSRDQAIKKAEQLRSAGEMMGYLTSGEQKPSI